MYMYVFELNAIIIYDPELKISSGAREFSHPDIFYQIF